MARHTITSSDLAAARDRIIETLASDGQRSVVYHAGGGKYLVYDDSLLVLRTTDSTEAAEAYNEIPLRKHV